MSLITLTPGIFFIAIFSLTTRWILAQKSLKVLIQFCLVLITTTLISCPIFSVLTNNFSEQGLLGSQLILQILGYGGVSLFFLGKTEGFSTSILCKDFCIVISFIIPAVIVVKSYESVFITVLIILTTIFITTLVYKDRWTNWFKELEN